MGHLSLRPEFIQRNVPSIRAVQELEPELHSMGYQLYRVELLLKLCAMEKTPQSHPGLRERTVRTAVTTIQHSDIIAKAQIARGTFYLYFDSPTGGLRCFARTALKHSFFGGPVVVGRWRIGQHSQLLRINLGARWSCLRIRIWPESW
jgi:hypothetical protein